MLRLITHANQQIGQTAKRYHGDMPLGRWRHCNRKLFITVSATSIGFCCLSGLLEKLAASDPYTERKSWTTWLSKTWNNATGTYAPQDTIKPGIYFKHSVSLNDIDKVDVVELLTYGTISALVLIHAKKLIPANVKATFSKTRHARARNRHHPPITRLNCHAAIRESVKRNFDHGGLFHLGFNAYLLWTVFQIDQEWDLKMLVILLASAIAGGAFFHTNRFGRNGLGISGGIWGLFGSYFVSGNMDAVSWKLIFDLREYPSTFTVRDLGVFVMTVEAALATLQHLRFPGISPIAHTAHVSGFVVGMLCEYGYRIAQSTVPQKYVDHECHKLQRWIRMKQKQVQNMFDLKK